jgi:hypothetical protein
MNDMERTTTDPTFDHVRGHPIRLQLPPGNHSVLATRQRRDLRVVLGRCERPKSTRIFHAANAAEEMRTRGAHFVPKVSSSPPVPPLALIPS